jgi:hypothetical protein
MERYRFTDSMPLFYVVLFLEINRVTLLVVNVLQKFYGVDNALPENISAHCYLGYSFRTIEF